MRPILYLIPSLLSFLIPTACWSSAVSVGGTLLEIPNPPGFAAITLQMTTLYRLQQRAASQGNQVLMCFIAESEIPKALKDEMPLMRRWFSIQADTELVGDQVSKSYFSWVKQVLKTHNGEVRREIEREFPGLIENVNKGITKEFGKELAASAAQIIPLPPHEETDRTLAISTFGKAAARVEVGNQTYRVGVGTTTVVHVKGKVLFFYCYAEEAALAWSRGISKQWVDSVLAANPPGPLSFLPDAGMSAVKGLAYVLIAVVVGGVCGALGYVRRRGKSAPKHPETSGDAQATAARLAEGTSSTPLSADQASVESPPLSAARLLTRDERHMPPETTRTRAKTVPALGRKATIEQFCKQFYDSQAFQPEPADERGFSALLDEVSRIVAAIETSLPILRPEALFREVVALRMEIWGLAFARVLTLHEPHSPATERCEQAEILFTKRYLHEKGRADVWKAMSAYNEAIRRGGTRGIKWHDVCYEHLVNTGMDPECAARLANRTCAGHSVPLAELGLALLGRLNPETSLEVESHARAAIEVVAPIGDLLDDAMKRLSRVEINTGRCVVEARRFASAKTIALGFLCIMGACCLWWLFVDGNSLSELALIRRARLAGGSLVATYEEEREDYRERVHFVTVGVYAYRIPDGRQFKASIEVPAGQTLEELAQVEYLPDKPAVSRVKGRGCQTVAEWVWRTVGLGSLLFLLFSLPGIHLVGEGIRELLRTRRTQRRLRLLSEITATP
jgi:hypothetical protein